jgi:hypothetical protein
LQSLPYQSNDKSIHHGHNPSFEKQNYRIYKTLRRSCQPCQSHAPQNSEIRRAFVPP